MLRGCRRGTRIGCSTPTATARSRTGGRSTRDGTVVLRRATACPAPAPRDDAARVLRPRALERAARERGALPRGGASPGAPGGGARRQLGPHGREGRHLAALRPLRRAEPRDGGRPAPLPRDRARSRARHRLAADRPLPPRAAARRVRGAPAPVRARPRAPARARRREHAEQRALRGAFRRAARRVVGAGGGGTPPAPLSAAPA